MKNHFDLIVLGAGSGGLAAAKRASSYGARVAIVEGDRVGGTCVIRGCVPKKLMVYGALFRDSLNTASSYGLDLKIKNFHLPILLNNIRKEVDRLNDIHLQLLEKSGVELIRGWGSFLDQNNILIKSTFASKKQTRKINGKNILIAVGGRPTRLDIEGSKLAWVSDDLFLQTDFPGKILVIGAGYIACEFSCILNSLGVEVTQLIRGERLLKGFDTEIAKNLSISMRERGINLQFGNTPVKIEGQQGDLKLISNSGLEFNSEAVLFATGREPFLDGLNSEYASITSLNGKIPVDEYSATNIPNIFALGDVTDRVNLTPVAIDEGRAFADRLFSGSSRIVDYNFIPSAVFSNPEIAKVGLTEQEAVNKYGNDLVKVFRSEFRSMSQSLSKKGPRCVLKLIINSDTDKVVGCHMFGEHASEIIQMASIAVRMGATKSDFDRTMALHPTIAEEFVTMS